MAAKRFVYILKSLKTQATYHVGLTSDIEARLADHNAETPRPTHRDTETRHPAGRPGIGAARLHRISGRHTLAPPMSHRDPPQAFVEGVGNALILTWVMWVGIAELAILAL